MLTRLSRSYYSRTVALSALVAPVLAALTGCASLTVERMPVPASVIARAAVPGLSHVRYWADAVPRDAETALKVGMPSLRKPPQPSTYQDGRPVLNYLALSGGGSYGAFGAGLLVGWTKSGKRPTFQYVTGISAGALIAPFAYMGPAYDRQLQEIWTKYGDDDLITKQPLGVLFGAAAAVDTQPLADLIAKYIDEPFLAAVAREYRKGRMLFIGTTNIDAKRPVVWNMGEIAISHNPRALQLFRDVLLASASIPGIMPPVKISVDADGQTFEELHVDGGVSRQVFLTPTSLQLTDFDKYYPAPPIRRIYVIRNGRLAPRYSPVDATAATLAATSISTLLDYQTSGDIYRIYVGAKRDRADFNLAADEYALEPSGQALFDREYMVKLFELSRASAARGYPWLTTLPEGGAAGR